MADSPPPIFVKYYNIMVDVYSWYLCILDAVAAVLDILIHYCCLLVPKAANSVSLLLMLAQVSLFGDTDEYSQNQSHCFAPGAFWLESVVRLVQVS
jgi:hypothetical protein